jgi:xylulokinase
MTDALVLGIDLGLSGVRAAVMSSDGVVVGVSDRHRITTRTAVGRAEQDPIDWLEGVARAATEALASVEGRRIAGVGISALGPAPVIVDKDLEPLTPALLFSLDTRAEPQRRRLCDLLGLPDSALNHDHAIPKLQWWADQRPAWWGDAACVLDATGFIVSRLTGIPVMDRITHEDYELPGVTAPVPTPDPVEPTAVVGPLTAAWAERLGLRPDVPVFAGIYDSYGDTAAAGALGHDDACLVLGSTLIIGVVQDRVPEKLDGLITAPHLGTGRLVGGWTTSGGTALDWARGLLAGTPRDELDAFALSSSPGAGGLVFLPYLAGERSPVHDPHASGVLLGATGETTPGEIYRAVLDGVVLSVRDHAERLAVAGIRPSRWRVRGGGAANRALVQGIADAVRAQLDVTEHPGDPVGPCVLALHGLGLPARVRVVDSYHPNPDRSQRYDRLFGVYAGLYPSLHTYMHDLRRLDEPDGGNQ